MKRREFLGTISATAAGALFSPHALAADELRRGLVTTPLVLMAPTSDGFDAAWGVSRLSVGKLLVSSEDGSAREVRTDAFGFTPQGDKVLKVRVRDLKPGKLYQVKALTVVANDGEEHASEQKSFRPLDPNATSTEFVVWNDTHINNQTIQELNDATPSADFLLWNGDTCNDWTSPDLQVPTLLNPGGRDITKGRPLFLTWGNHDVRGPRAFEMPQVVATPNHRPFYAFRSGPVAAVCLHTGEDKPDSHPSFRGRVAFDALRREQAGWLEETIGRPEIREAPYRIVFCHIPLRWRNEAAPNYETGGFDHFSLRSREAWHSLLVKWKADVVISGHTHHAAWLPATGEFSYGQLVGGGPQRKAATWMQAKADSSKATITVRNLDGVVLHEVTLQPHS